MRYKVGDKVWIRDDIDNGFKDDGGNYYRVNMGEIDIRGKLVKITNIHGCYDCNGYRSFHDSMINHSKTAYENEKHTYTRSSQIPDQDPQYEIY